MPTSPQDDSPKPANNNDAALSLIRQKLARVYAQEPSVKEEESEVKAVGPKSKHQRYIEQLMSSGRSFADIQTAWHKYYQGLPDADKHQVWREFYAYHEQDAKYPKKPAQTQKPAGVLLPPIEQPVSPTEPAKPAKTKKAKQLQTVGAIKDHILQSVNAGGKLKPKHHIKSILFGLSMGILVIFIFLFGFFNERFIAPFITPSRNVTNTPIIVDAAAGYSVSLEPKVIIPKINIEVPVVYDVATIDDKAIQAGLGRGVVHYPTTPVPGQNGNVAIVGHSAENIFNSGRYKYVFSLLHDLQIGDTFMLNYAGKQYTYKIYSKKIVAPSDVSVLGPTDKVATVTLITCDPPGLSTHRLIIIGEQISPDPSANSAGSQIKTTDQPNIIPGNSESLFHRLFSWIWE